MRGPIKNQALRVLSNRGIRIGTVLDVGVLTGTAELMAHFPQALHMLFEPVVEFNPEIARNLQPGRARDRQRRNFGFDSAKRCSKPID